MEVKKRANHPLLRDFTVDKQRDGVEGPFELRVIPVDMDVDGDMADSVAVRHVDPRNALQQRNATKKGQGKWHRAIREALIDAADMRLDGTALIKSATAKVPERERTSNPRKQLLATINEMADLGELRATGGDYKFASPTTAANPDAGRRP